MNKNLSLIEQGIAARHAKSRRFRRYGQVALAFASLMLLWLIGSIVLPGLSGLTRYEATFELTQSDITHATGADGINYNKALHQAFDRKIKDTDISPRSAYMLLGQFASFEAKHAWENRAKDASNVNITVPLSDTADQFLKSGEEGETTLNKQQQTLLNDLNDRHILTHTISRDLFTRGDSRAPESAGIVASLVGSLLLVFIALGVSLPIGVMAALYLEEFAPKNALSDIIEVSINNLAAVPSIIFGLLGLSVYLLLFDLPRSSALVGGLTVALMVLPTIIITTRASLRAVPPSVRLAATALGASPVQVALHHVVPYALPGIMTGTILAVARAMGETAPLLMIGMVAFVADIPRGFTDPATAMPVQVYIWASSPELGFIEKTASAILLLLLILMALNAVAIYIRNKFEIRW